MRKKQTQTETVQRLSAAEIKTLETLLTRLEDTESRLEVLFLKPLTKQYLENKRKSLCRLVNDIAEGKFSFLVDIEKQTETSN